MSRRALGLTDSGERPFAPPRTQQSLHFAIRSCVRFGALPTTDSGLVNGTGFVGRSLARRQPLVADMPVPAYWEENG